MNAHPALRLTSVVKQYWNAKALRELTLEIPQGAVAAFVGANGAGKTTTFSLVAGFIRPTSGSIEIFGKSRKQFLASGGRLGLVPQDMEFIEDRSISSQLQLFAELAGFSARNAKEEVRRVLEATSLIEKQKATPGELSHGMRVRLGVAQALIGDPPLLFFDEPTAGLDPLMVDEFCKLVQSLSHSDSSAYRRTVVVSSHDLSVLERISTYVCIIDKGQLIQQGALSAVIDAAAAVVVESPVFPASIEIELSGKLPGFRVQRVSEATLRIGLPAGASVESANSEILAALLGLGVKIRSIQPESGLTETYLNRARQARATPR